MKAAQVIRLPAGQAISGHPRAVSVLVRREDWPWQDDFAPLDATPLIPQGSHDSYACKRRDAHVIGFAVIREGTWE